MNMKNLTLVLLIAVLQFVVYSCGKSVDIIDSDQLIFGNWEHRSIGHLKFTELQIGNSEVGFIYPNDKYNDSFPYTLKVDGRNTTMSIDYNRDGLFTTFIVFQLHGDFIEGWKAGERIELIRKL